MITTSFDDQWATPISRAKARSLSNKERFKQKTYEKNPATAGSKIYNELMIKGVRKPSKRRNNSA